MRPRSTIEKGPPAAIGDAPALAGFPARGEGAGAAEDRFPACGLERLLGAPRSAWTGDHLVAFARERGIRIVSLMHLGGDGCLKTLDFAPASPAHLRDILEGGERADGSSLFAGLGIRPGASDIVLRPRIGSAFLDPFSPLPTLVLLCGHAGRDGRPLPESPDTILRRAAERLRIEIGAELRAHGEIEYFLGRRQGEAQIYGEADRGYHAASPFVFGEGLRRHALATLAEMGVPVKYGHSEVGWVGPAEADGWAWEQHEIELALAPLPEAAEAVALTHWVLRNLARRESMVCSFDPILLRGHAGTGMHFHFAPVVDGEAAEVRREDGTLSDPARWLIAGLVRLGGALMAFGNRATASFVRLSQAKEAPAGVTWGEFDRSALVRLPLVARTEAGRAVTPPTIEFRLPDGTAHAHLLLAGVAQAMVHGSTLPDLDAVLDAASASAAGARPGQPSRVPASFAEVAEAVVRHRAILEAGGVFPPALLDQVLARLGA